MPIKQTKAKPETAKFYKSLSYETLAASWFQMDGWEVFFPMADHGSKTDLVISDGTTFHRIQVKSLETKKEDIMVQSQWEGADIDYVLFFSRYGQWGYITHPFSGKVKLNQNGHLRFHQNCKNFNRMFARI
ncbi:group I intron-associated PD-(D/E)XK endonuclease [Shewanella halotolerans]|uniref:group I intron-associated PD-(D/E)XK endonuclease n=1 Tax=Shewanella halotolerans TaxID=2864204 RepID=UPI001C65F11B|nr:group I intron-associated PD-(D/E)XK endonuclease [Shewanella halotolerans]QYJ88847.1 hypothetical protein K0H81_13775 [Shewanella halotolerans]